MIGFPPWPRPLVAAYMHRWVNIRCCSGLFDDGPTRKVLAAFRSRLSMPKHPRDRGTVLGMERPQTQLRARPPSRSPRGPHGGGGGSGCQGPPDDRAKTGRPSVGGGARSPRFSSGSGGSAYRGDVVPLGAGGSGGDGGSAAAMKAAAVEGCAGESGERKREVPSSVSPTRETASTTAMEKSAQGGEDSVREQGKKHVHAHATPPTGAKVPAVEAPAPTTPAGVELPATTSEPSTGAAAAAAAASAAAIPPAAAEASAAPCRADPLPLLPAGVGNLSLGQHRRRVGTPRRTPSIPSLKAAGTIPWDSGDASPTQGQLRSRDERHGCGEGENGRGRGGGEEAVEVRLAGVGLLLFGFAC